MSTLTVKMFRTFEFAGESKSPDGAAQSRVTLSECNGELCISIDDTSINLPADIVQEFLGCLTVTDGQPPTPGSLVREAELRSHAADGPTYFELSPDEQAHYDRMAELLGIKTPVQAEPIRAETIWTVVANDDYSHLTDLLDLRDGYFLTQESAKEYLADNEETYDSVVKVTSVIVSTSK